MARRFIVRTDVVFPERYDVGFAQKVADALEEYARQLRLSGGPETRTGEIRTLFGAVRWRARWTRERRRRRQ